LKEVLAMLTAEERRAALAIARASIARGLHLRYPDAVLAAPRAGEEEGALAGTLADPAGAFVTLRINHDLRGCIGYIESSDPLATVIDEVAEKAAFEDPRFPPLTPDEFRRVHIEISVLSPMKRITSIEEIVVGTHGLLFEHGWHRGLLLPQVATEYGWGREEFLDNVSRKAGLPRAAWRDENAKLFIFSAIVFAEHEESHVTSS
jgi:AmmeMemoRadiSam system protein A